MTLLITVFAAIVSTIVWYMHKDRRMLRLSLLCQMFWGASLMWLVDGIFEYAEDGAEIFAPTEEAMLQDAFLGISVVALGLVIWMVALLLRDPKGVIRSSLSQNK